MSDIHPLLIATLDAVNTRLDQILGRLNGPQEDRSHYTVEEAAEKLGRRPYTVREWCRSGRINATKRLERRGGAELWSISGTELVRYRNDGLLAPDPSRNAGR
jgi:hypothetical protein